MNCTKDIDRGKESVTSSNIGTEPSLEVRNGGDSAKSVSIEAVSSTVHEGHEEDRVEHQKTLGQGVRLVLSIDGGEARILRLHHDSMAVTFDIDPLLPLLDVPGDNLVVVRE